MPPTKKPVALTIAGSDASGGAGIQADLKTFHQFGVYGEAVITLIAVQNTQGVQRVECLDSKLVADQIQAAISDIPPAAAKTGALGNRAIIEAVAALARDFQFPLVTDPVMLSKNGAALLEADISKAILLMCCSTAANGPSSRHCGSKPATLTEPAAPSQQPSRRRSHRGTNLRSRFGEPNVI
jgi:hydroxymethylpyrimidine/phosphomethylpyrimidine kinase